MSLRMHYSHTEAVTLLAAHLPAWFQAQQHAEGAFLSSTGKYGLIPSRTCSRTCPAESPLVSDNSKSQAMTPHFVFH